MFGFRSDGKRIKNAPLLFRIIPHIMEERADAQVYYKQEIPLKNMDEYMENKSKEGIKISYMNIIYAAMVRTIAERPGLNRFVVAGRTYNRNGIFISLAIKKSLEDTSPETVVKLEYSGAENIFEVRDKLDSAIQENKAVDNKNSLDKIVDALGKTPNIILKIAVKSLKVMDKYGVLPKAIIKASPFHTSAWLTNVGSIGIDAIYHHVYNFGTTSLFFAMGKKKRDFVPDDEEIVEEKCITIAFVGDERICDGYYFANSFKTFNKYVKRPELLENGFVEKSEAVN